MAMFNHPPVTAIPTIPVPEIKKDSTHDTSDDDLVKCWYCEDSYFASELVKEICPECRQRYSYAFVEDFDVDSIQKVIPGLYIGSLNAVNKPEELIKNNIKIVVSLTGLPVTLADPSITRYLVSFDDNQDGALECRQKKLFPAIGGFIQAHHMHTNKNIVVHCQAGVSRCASVICYYLMHVKKPGLSYDEAVALIKQARPIIDIPYYFQALLKVKDED